jgi:pimeloyl-ACP methyl ester carboxylesterase
VRSYVMYKGKNSLCYAENGNPTGFPVLVQHGMIASIADDHLFRRLIDEGVRLISIARPGYGESSPYIMNDVAEWGEIVQVLVEKLHLPEFDVFGISSGAPYGYSIGARLPGNVRDIFILSGTPALYDNRIAALWPYPMAKDASIRELQQIARKLFFADLDPQELSRNDNRDSMANDCFGIAQDLKLRCVNWGFSLSDVAATVYMQHSKADAQVPFMTAEITSRLLPHCIWAPRETGEHFSAEELDAFIEATMIRNYKGNLTNRCS